MLLWFLSNKENLKNTLVHTQRKKYTETPVGMRSVKTPQKSGFLFYPRGISATLLLSTPDGLPISKSSLKEAEDKPTGKRSVFLERWLEILSNFTNKCFEQILSFNKESR